MYYDEKLVTVGNLGMIMWLNRNQGDKNNIGLQNLDLLVTIFLNHMQLWMQYLGQDG